VPFEGCPISLFTPEQREEVFAIVEVFNSYLPAGPLEHKMRRVREHEASTYFAWIGKFDLGSPYYFRIHSPATFCEFDFHCGIFLTSASNSSRALLLARLLTLGDSQTRRRQSATSTRSTGFRTARTTARRSSDSGRRSRARKGRLSFGVQLTEHNVV